MLLALLLAAGSALIGGALALAARGRPGLLELTRTFAFAAAAGVVGLHLFPEMLRELGAPGLLWAGMGFALPGLLEAGARALGPGLRERGFSGARVAAEVGFAALFVHSLLEGLALRAAVAAPGPHADLEIALVAHHAPLTAAVALPLLELLGPGPALARVLLVAAAGAAGALFGGPSPEGQGGFVAAAGGAMAGALLHVVADEIRAQPPSSAARRVADLAACAAGLLVAGLGAAFQPVGGRTGAAVAGVLHQTAALVLAAAPALLAGDLLSAALRGRGGGRAAGFADLPGASPPALLVTGRLLGAWSFGARVLLAAAAPLAGALGARLWPRPASQQPAPAPLGPPSSAAESADGPPGAVGAFLVHLGECTPRRLAVLLLGGATLGVLTGGAGFEPPPGGPPVLAVVAVLGACSALSGAAAAALAIPALLAGAPPLPSLLAMVLLPVLLRLLRARASARDGGPLLRRALLALLAAAGAFAGYLALGSTPVADDALLAARLQAAPLALPLADQLRASPLSALCALGLAVPALVTLWRAGARGWLLPLRHGGLDDGPAGRPGQASADG